MGCGMALHSYMVDCADLIAGRTNKCQMPCERALIALMSTEEGQELMDCDCEGSKFCELNKERIEVCRSDVLQATAQGTIVSCSIARWMCMADSLCNTALDFYHRLCRGLFHGRRCTLKCNNSLSILNRQEKAAKLRTCYCDGSEDFPCQRIKDNTERLCFGKEIDFDFDVDEHNEINVMAGKSDSNMPLMNNILILISLWSVVRILFIYTER
jgi:growth arrest-specific protein 1